MDKTVVWIVPEKSGGIATYARELMPSLRKGAVKRGISNLALFTPSGKKELFQSIPAVAALSPAIIHIQHEYGSFGGKVPPFYFYPKWLSRLRAACPKSKVVVTLHTVIPPDYQYPIHGRGWQKPLRTLANAWILSQLKRAWREKTFGNTDGIIVHSALQVAEVHASTRALVTEIPHYVLEAPRVNPPPRPDAKPTVLVFGYLSPEKGQDTAISAWRFLQGKADLLIAGGVRRESDRAYATGLRESVRVKSLEENVHFVDFVPDAEIDALYAQATLVLAPFRETSGSGSITHAFARGKPVLTSDLALNRELNARVSGTVSLYRTGDAQDLAEKVKDLLEDPVKLTRLGTQGRNYAERYAPLETTLRHFDFYDEILARK